MADLDAKRVAEMTGAEARKLITSAVANGVVLAGLVLLLLNFVVGMWVAPLLRR